MAEYKPPIGAPDVDPSRCREAVVGHYNVKHQCRRKACIPSGAPRWCRLHSPAAKQRRQHVQTLKAGVERLEKDLRAAVLALGWAFIDAPDDVPERLEAATRLRAQHAEAVQALESATADGSGPGQP